jgi:hypothetical protein
MEKMLPGAESLVWSRDQEEASAAAGRGGRKLGGRQGRITSGLEGLG